MRLELPKELVNEAILKRNCQSDFKRDQKRRSEYKNNRPRPRRTERSRIEIKLADSSTKIKGWRKSHDGFIRLICIGLA
ncbi:hypothetical protein DTPHA_1401881 [Enterococcus faecium]|nr:hypothetical protein DTPHA_1401881 [Enterococcus faecium]